MARLIIIGLVTLVLVATTSACASGGGGKRSAWIASMKPNYDIRRDAVGLGVESRPSSDVDVRVRRGVGVSDILRGQISPQGDEMRRSEEMAVNDEQISRLLFSVFDLDKDGNIDAADWTREGGKVATFDDMLKIYDANVDDEISLEEFLQIPLMSDLGVGLDLTLFKQKVFPQPAEQLARQPFQPEQVVAAQPAEPEQD